MRFVMFKGEKSLNDLATRVFRIQGRGSQAATKQAAAALLTANPQLKDLSNVPVGSLIAVPDTAPPIAPGQNAIAGGLVASFATETSQTTLDSLHQQLSDLETQAMDRVKAATGRMQAPEMKPALKAIADLDLGLAGSIPTLDSIAKDAKEILKTGPAAQDTRTKTVTQLRAALASLAKE
jgi:hypothetical protein